MLITAASCLITNALCTVFEALSTTCIVIFVSVFVYYINYFSSLFGANETIPIVLSIWLPHLILSLTCIIGIMDINEH